MSLSVPLVYIVGVLSGLGVVLRPKETMDLHNSWAHILASLQQIDHGSKYHPLEDMYIYLPYQYLRSFQCKITE